MLLIYYTETGRLETDLENNLTRPSPPTPPPSQSPDRKKGRFIDQFFSTSTFGGSKTDSPAARSLPVVTRRDKNTNIICTCRLLFTYTR